MSDEHDLPVFSDVSTRDLVALFGDLEELVVSLDRLMSRIGNGADSSILVQYLADRSIRARLARGRGDVGDALARSIGEAAVECIAESQYRYSERNET